jgi:hypothetical protein
LADENGNNGELPKIVVGVCAMDRKVKSRHFWGSHTSKRGMCNDAPLRQ